MSKRLKYIAKKLSDGYMPRVSASGQVFYIKERDYNIIDKVRGSMTTAKKVLLNDVQIKDRLARRLYEIASHNSVSVSKIIEKGFEYILEDIETEDILLDLINNRRRDKETKAEYIKKSELSKYIIKYGKDVKFGYDESNNKFYLIKKI